MYNENPRVLDVLDSLQKCRKISEIISVDDGSNDGSADIVSEKFRNVRVLQHQKNLGKLEAVRTGLNSCNNESLILMDADLKNIVPEEIDKSIGVFERNNLDCLLLCTKPTGTLDKIARHFFRLAHIATGCRIIKKEVLEYSIANSGTFGYHLEPAQNKFLMENHKTVAYVNISAKGTSKSVKIGFYKGVFREFRMWYEVLSYSGIFFNVKQAILFARRREVI